MEDGVDLGTFSLSLAVEDIVSSLAFYRALGFEVVDGGHASADFPDSDARKWRIVQHRDIRIGLFQGMFERNVLTFNPGDVRAVERALKAAGVTLTAEAEAGSGPAHVMLEDPDGNPILMDQHGPAA